MVDCSLGFKDTSTMNISRRYLKNVFWLKVFVGASFLILEILKYSSGLKRGSAATLNQNPIFGDSF
jgi:hypothetical protein